MKWWRKLTRKLRHLDVVDDNGGLSGLWLASDDLKDMVNHATRSRVEMKTAQHNSTLAVEHLESTIDTLKIKAAKELIKADPPAIAVRMRKP